MKMFKRILLLVLVILIIAQFFRTPKNLSAVTTYDIAKNYPVPSDVHAILTKACFDCHSNKTRYPWYSEIQPVSWWLGDHINDGKRELNFNEFTSYRIGKQYRKMEACMDEVKKGGMPLGSYTIIHSDARLTDAEKTTLVNWFSGVHDIIQSTYPADSLIRKKPPVKR